MKDLRKALVVGVMSITVFSMSMLVAPVQVGAATAGDLIKMDGLSSVYYLGADGKRYVFPNETTYFSWYSDFSGVVTIQQSELESYPLGANVTMRPGTKLVKITTDPKVYAVEPDGTLLHVPDEATAIALWGESWAQRVVDVPDAFFTNYTVSSEAVSETAFPTGSLIKTADSATIYYIDSDGTARAVTDEAAFLANRFSFDNVITASLEIPTAGDDIAGAVSGIIDTSSGAGGTAGAGTGLSVSISSDTPEAGNIPDGSPTDFLKLNFTASADGNVTVNSITLKAYGLGTATYIDSVTLYNDGVKIGNAKNMNSDRVATFNLATGFNIPAGTTESLMVKATINHTAGNYSIGVESASVILTNGAAVSGSFPIIGNTKAVVDATIGTVTLSSVDGTDTTGVQFGTDDVLLANFNLAAANEAVIWESFSLKNGGSNNNALLENVRVLVDGTEVATAAGLVDKYVNFSMSNYLIAKNDTITVDVYGDVGIGNVGDTVKLYLKEANDMAFVGQSYGYGIQVTSAALWDTSAEGKTITLATGDFTINMDKSATPAKDILPGSNDVVLATIEITSNGENATTDGLNSDGGTEFKITGTGLTVGEIENVELRDTSTGALYDLTASSTSAGTAWDLSTTEEISFAKGVIRTFELRVDVGGTNDTYPIDNNDTLQVTLEDGAFNLTGETSDASITNITPSSVTSAVATVKTASLTWTTTSLTDKSVVPGATDVIVYQASLKVGASSDITLSSVRLDLDATYYESFNDTEISKLALYLNGELVKALSNQIVGETAGVNDADGYINFTSLTSNNVATKGTTATLQVKADFASTFPTHSTFSLEIGNAATSIIVKENVENETFNESVANVLTDSRKLTLAEVGTLKVELKVDDAKANDDNYLLAGAETVADHYLGELVFTSANEPILVQKLALQQHGTADNSDVLAVRLYDAAGTMVAQEGVNANGHVLFDPLDLQLNADQATSYFIGVVSKGINVDGEPTSTATHGHTVIFTLASSSVLTGQLGLSADEAVVAQGVNSGTSVTIAEDGDATVSDSKYASWKYATTTIATISGSVLTSITNNLADGVIKQGNDKVIGKYTFVFDNGSNRVAVTNEALKAELYQLKLTVATSGVSLSDVKAYVDGFPSNIATSTNDGSGTLWTFGPNQLNDNLSESALVDETVNLVITGDVTVTGATNSYLQTMLNDLDGASSDFSYNGNNGTGSQFSDPLLDIITLDGATLQQ
ncbi:MAG: hypothetical protein U9R06_02965 [Patescibacteria group bacterium]|nr:hypothetical protein [Patescibacteria group bacterium]